MDEINVYTAYDESGYQKSLEARSAYAAAAKYVASGDYDNSSTGYIDVTVVWVDGLVREKDMFRIAIPNWTGCAAE